MNELTQKPSDLATNQHPKKHTTHLEPSHHPVYPVNNDAKTKPQQLSSRPTLAQAQMAELKHTTFGFTLSSVVSRLGKGPMWDRKVQQPCGQNYPFKENRNSPRGVLQKFGTKCFKHLADFQCPILTSNHHTWSKVYNCTLPHRPSFFAHALQQLGG